MSSFVTGLLGEGTGCSLPVAPLLNHLLLLRPGNADAKACYLSLIPRVLGAAVETGVNIEAARQLLSYSLIHPAISTDDRRVLTQWLRHLEDRISNPAPNTGQGQQQQEQSNNWGDLAIHHNGHGGLFVDGQPRVRRSNSLTPPVSIPQAADLSSSQDDLCARPKPRSFSLSSEHAPLSPQSSLASSGSGSESHLDELRAQHAGGLTSDACGMKDVAAWLKSLRLHKYSWLFASMTYDEMLALTEDALEARGVTKGARHKIVLSIKKLRERSSTLSQLEMDVVKGGGLRAALEELRVILATPIKPVPLAAEQQTEGTTEQEDLPRQITKVLGKVVTQLLVGGQVDEEAVGLTHTLLERCLTHEAFGPHRSRISTWRQQLLQLWPPLGTLAPHDSQQRPTPPRK
ncbi:hypothetical protein B566_EDAN018608 [Ephemera danica]|nr:hypothetical protein B566_EDAN018608 [Ephemera danica]